MSECAGLSARVLFISALGFCPGRFLMGGWNSLSCPIVEMVTSASRTPSVDWRSGAFQPWAGC